MDVSWRLRNKRTVVLESAMFDSRACRYARLPPTVSVFSVCLNRYVSRRRRFNFRGEA